MKKNAKTVKEVKKAKVTAAIKPSITFGSGFDPKEIGIDRGCYDYGYDHHGYCSGDCGNPSDGD